MRQCDSMITLLLNASLLCRSMLLAVSMSTLYNYVAHCLINVEYGALASGVTNYYVRATQTSKAAQLLRPGADGATRVVKKLKHVIGGEVFAAFQDA